LNYSMNQKRRVRIMRLPLLLVSLGLLVSCSPKPEPEVLPSPSPSVVLPLPSPSVSATPASPTPTIQTFQEKSGLFRIAFPRGYTHKTTSSGVAFMSADQGFAGSVDFGSAAGKQLNTQQLEAALKTELASRLQQVAWQTSQVQPDGSLRIDWTGKDKSGSALDAVSLVEQRGDYIFVLNLFGVGKPYQNYNSDAETIVNSYQINPQKSPAASPSP
jgi:hypothetical protein